MKLSTAGQTRVSRFLRTLSDMPSGHFFGRAINLRKRVGHESIWCLHSLGERFEEPWAIRTGVLCRDRQAVPPLRETERHHAQDDIAPNKMVWKHVIMVHGFETSPTRSIIDMDMQFRQLYTYFSRRWLNSQDVLERELGMGGQKEFTSRPDKGIQTIPTSLQRAANSE